MGGVEGVGGVGGCENVLRVEVEGTGEDQPTLGQQLKSDVY